MYKGTGTHTYIHMCIHTHVHTHIGTYMYIMNCFYSRKEKYQEVRFPCPHLCNSSAGVWHHVVLLLQAKGLRGKSKATLFLDGQALGTPQKVCNMECRRYPSDFTYFLSWSPINSCHIYTCCLQPQLQSLRSFPQRPAPTSSMH